MRSPPKERLELPALDSFLEFCKSKDVPARTMIIHAGEAPETLYFIRSGSVEVIIEDEDGDEMIIAYLNPGHFFGEMGLFNEDQARSAFVRARTDCTLAEMTYPIFRRLSAENPELVVELATQIANRLASVNFKIADLAFLDVTGRVAHALIDLTREPDARPNPDGIAIQITRPQLARIVGCSREMVSRVLKNMEAQGIIGSIRHGLVVFETALRRSTADSEEKSG